MPGCVTSRISPIKDGLHVYGRAGAAVADPAWARKRATEREALLAALDGKRVRPGPAGSPQRGRRDVLPTGRNLFTADPRMLPTPTAMESGGSAPTRWCASTCRPTARCRARS